jgi:hypothetical protein
MSKAVDLDAMLGADALELTVGGKTYIVKDAPVQFLMMIEQKQETKEPLVLLEFLRAVLGPLGFDTEAEKQIGTRGVILAVAVITDHFISTPEALKNMAPGVGRALAKARADLATGPESSPIS